MKKTLKLTLILFIIIGTMMIMSDVYALSCNLTIQTSKTEFEKDEEFTANLYVSNIQSNRGVISLTATLQYDKDALTLVKMEGQNGWETPIEGISYNKENGKIVITKNGLGKSNEVIFKMTFKAKKETSKPITIALKDVGIADGEKIAKFNVKKDITIKKVQTKPDVPEIDKSEIDKPVTDKPSTDKPVTGKPKPDKPTTDKKDTNKPIASEKETNNQTTNNTIIDNSIITNTIIDNTVINNSVINDAVANDLDQAVNTNAQTDTLHTTDKSMNIWIIVIITIIVFLALIGIGIKIKFINKK